MQITPLRAWIQAFLWCASLALPGQMPEVQERILKNGLRVLLVERPGSGFLHAQFFLRGGKSASAPLSPLAAELLAQSFNEPLPSAAWPALENLLKQEEGAFESLRLARLQRVRRGSGEPSPEAQELDALQRRTSQQIRDLALQARAQDPLPRMGAVNRAAHAEADYITWEAEFPKVALRAWCSLQVEMLRNPRLPWFPLERDGMLEALGKEPDAAQDALSILLGTALTGRTYAQVFDLQRSGVEALAWSDMLGYARREIASERLVLVLVGDTQMPAKDLDETLGTLPLDPDSSHRLEDFSGDLPGAPGARRLQASTPRERRLLMAWRVPPISHPDTPLLQVVAQILAGGRNSRLLRTVVAEKHVAKSITAKMGIPGGRQSGLLVLESMPEAEHALGELEQAIQGEVMRFQQEDIPVDEIRRAQRMVEADQVMIQEDAGRLATAIGAAQCEGGDWRLSFRALQLTRDFTPEEIRSVARRYLVSVQATTALLEPDPILNPQGGQEAQLVRVLTRLLSSRLQDPAQVESVIRETLRQIRMLPPLDQEKTLKLLEAQVNP